MRWLRKGWRWVSRHWKLVLAGCAILLSVVLGLRYRKNTITARIQKHKLAILRSQKDVIALEAQRDRVREREGEVSLKLDMVNADLANLDEDIMRSRSRIKRLTSAEKLAEFKDMGY